MKQSRRKLHMAIFGIYCALMLWLLFDRPGAAEGIPYWQQVQSNLNLIPFRTLKLFSGLLDDHRPYLVRLAVVNLLGNVVMFIPLGIFLPLVFANLRKQWKTLLISALVITAAELLQLFTLLGSCDVDDLILNLLGCALGYWLFKLTAKPDC